MAKKLFVFKEKIYRLKERLRVYNIQVFGKIDLDVEKPINKLNVMDKQVAANPEQVHQDVSVRRVEAQNFVWHKQHWQELILKPKSRCKWLKEGGKNSKLIHSFMRIRYCCNGIVSFNSNGDLIQDVDGIKLLAFNHFKSHFQELDFSRPMLERVAFKKLNFEDNTFLKSLFLVTKIKEVILISSEDKILSPNKLSMSFLNVCQEIIKLYLVDCIKEFFVHAHIVEPIVASFIALVPKIKNP